MKKSGTYLKCHTCQKEIYIPPWKYRNKKNKTKFFCSKNCWLSRASVSFTCKTCGKIFRRRESNTKRNKSHYYYCSRKCRYKDPDSFARKRKLTNCKVCGNPLVGRCGKMYCSLKCRSADEEYRKLIRESKSIKRKMIGCAICGKGIFKHEYQFKRSKSLFCSRKCKNLYERGKPSKRRTGKVVKCFNCEKEIYRALWRLKDYNRFFCSLECMYDQLKYNVKNIAKPTKIERMFWELVKKYNLPYKYVGDGSFWIGRLNPDFIHTNGEKIVIEIFGDFWHNPSLNKRLNFDHTEDGRNQLFKRYGYKCIVIWEKEFKGMDWENRMLSKLGVNSNADICNSKASGKKTSL